MEKKLYVIRASNLRALIDMANKCKVTKDEYIAIIQPSLLGGEYSLVYYK